MRELDHGPAEVIGLAKLIMALSVETGLDEIFLYESWDRRSPMSGAEFCEGLDARLEERPARFIDKRNL